MKWEREFWRTEWQRLTQLEWQALDVKEAGQWPLLLKALCGVLAFSMMLGGISWWLVGEKRAELATAQRQEARLLSEYRRKAVEVAYLPDIQRQLATLEEQMEQMRDMLPTDAEIPSLLDSISDAAVENRLTIETIRLRPTTTQALYIEHPLDIQVRGGYHQLAQFAADISQKARIITQHDFTLEPVDQQGDELRLSLLARTYSYIGAPNEETSP